MVVTQRALSIESFLLSPKSLTSQGVVDKVCFDKKIHTNVLTDFNIFPVIILVLFYFVHILVHFYSIFFFIET